MTDGSRFSSPPGGLYRTIDTTLTGSASCCWCSRASFWTPSASAAASAIAYRRYTASVLWARLSSGWSRSMRHG